jgi:hypothetical protein
MKTLIAATLALGVYAAILAYAVIGMAGAL